MVGSKHKTLKKAFMPAIVLVGLMWVVYLLQQNGYPEIVGYGVKPKKTEGLLGILTAPFIHSPLGYSHIINNSIPMFVLTWALYYFYKAMAASVLTVIWITTGLCVWITGELHSNHIGMSGVIYGLAGFLFLSGVLRKNKNLMGLSLLVAFEYGSMIWGVLPIKEGVSWESHLWGILVGLAIAYVLRKDGPQRKKYLWEIEEELGLDETGDEYWMVDENDQIPQSTKTKASEKTVSFQYFFTPKKKEDPKD